MPYHHSYRPWQLGTLAMFNNIWACEFFTILYSQIDAKNEQNMKTGYFILFMQPIHNF